jgi:hypothetical protein
MRDDADGALGFVVGAGMLVGNNAVSRQERQQYTQPGDLLQD